MKFCLSFFAATSLALSSLIALPAMAEDTPSADTVLATIDGTDITLGHMIALRASLPPHYAQVSADVLFNGILDQLVQQTLLSQSLENGPSQRSKLTIENETRAITASEAMDLAMSDGITEEEIMAAYERDYVNVNPQTEFNAAHILVKTKEEAESLIAQLNEGADFAALAREHSTGPSGPNGGGLGWFVKGVMLEPFFNAVVAIKAGEISDPVETQYGWHVIKLLETRSKDRPTLDEVREQLEVSLREEAFEAHIEKLRTKAKIRRIDISTIDAELLNNLDLLEN